MSRDPQRPRAEFCHNTRRARRLIDLYKRYVNPARSDRHYVVAGYVCSVLVLVVGVIFGYMAGSINQVTQWIVSGLFGGYTAPNVLKWHWYRLNGYGYFWGMLGGIGSALAMPLVAPGMHPLDGFPVILGVSTLGGVLGSLLTDPEPDAVLVEFYSRVRPWGFWGPVHAKAVARHPGLQRNRNCARDMTNTAVAIVWQFTLVTGPLYLCLWNLKGVWISAAVFVAGSVFLKLNWYDTLEREIPVAPSVRSANQHA